MGSVDGKKHVPIYPESTPHLNPHGLVILSSSHSGRGVYTSRQLARGVLVEISPVLLFPREEYLTHGRHTALDSYTFVWRDKNRGGQKIWALALGLGSLFNHSPSPNVSYTLDYVTLSIRYTTSQPIAAGEELFICYGRDEDMWWNKPPSSDKIVNQAHAHTCGGENGNGRMHSGGTNEELFPTDFDGLLEDYS